MIPSLTELSALEGLVPDDVGETLLDLAAAVDRELAIVEVGSFKGKSTSYLAAGAQSGHGARVFAVDPWDLAGNVNGRFGFAQSDTRKAFDRQLRSVGLRSHVTAKRGFSIDVAAKWDGPPIGLLFIDGDHAAESVSADLGAWTPHLAPRATVVFDDLDTPKNPGVRAALEALGLEWKLTARRLAVVELGAPRG